MEDYIRGLLLKATQYYESNENNPLNDDDVNVFSIINMENKEVAVHSAMLYFIFKPFFDNGKIDDNNLRLLLKVFGFEKDYKHVSIMREVSIPNSLGRLDFLITMDDELLAIELKIWAKEQYEQISRYTQFLESQGANKNNIIFLTPTKRETTTGDAKNFTLIGDIKPLIEKIINSRCGHTDYCAILSQYIKVINKLCREKEIKLSNLFRNQSELLAVDYLVNERKQIMNFLLENFFISLCDKLVKENLSNEYANVSLYDYKYGTDSIKNYYNGAQTYPAIVFELDNYKLNLINTLSSDYKLFFFIEINHNLYTGLSLRKEMKGDLQIMESEDFDLLKRSNNDILQENHSKKNWLKWYHIKNDGRKINFRDFSSDDFWLKTLFTQNSLELDEVKMNQIVYEVKRQFNQFTNTFLF